jgi:hypothetical protein
LIALAVAIGIVLLQISDDSTQQADAPRRAASHAGQQRPEPSGAAGAAGTSSTTTSTTVGARAPDEVTVLVLNASGRSNQARPMSERLRVVGYKTLEPGNAPKRPKTSVLCREAFKKDAAALASATGLSAETGELSSKTDLPGIDGADCVVVIGAR